MIRTRIILVSLAFVLSAVSLFAWLMDWKPLLSVVAGRPTIKATTACALLLLSVASLTDIQVTKEKYRSMVTALGFTVVGMTIFFLFHALNSVIGMQLPPALPLPSVVTMFSILLLAWGRIFLASGVVNRFLPMSGGLVTFCGLCALTGHVTGVPMLYYMYSGFFDGMAIPTAIICTLLGVVEIMDSTTREKVEEVWSA